MQYEDVVRVICGADWYRNTEDRNGGYGIAIVLAYLKGVQPELGLIAKHLEIKSTDIIKAFSRLSQNNVFTEETKKDTELMGKDFSQSATYCDEWTREQSYKSAWAHIAAIAGGIIERP